MKKRYTDFGNYIQDRYGSVYAFTKECKEHNLPISGPYLHKLATGEKDNITLKMVVTLASVLGLTVAEVLGLFGVEVDK